jgi:hypothetical protein
MRARPTPWERPRRHPNRTSTIAKLAKKVAMNRMLNA